MNKSFVLLGSLLILIVFSFLSIDIIQNKSYSSKINNLKYFELQALIHIQYIKKKIKQGIIINDVNISDDRYIVSIINDTNNKNYFINIKHKTEHISINDTFSLD